MPVNLTDYVDLPLAETNPQVIAERAFAVIDSKFPDWQPREAALEVALVEAVAVEVAEAAYALNNVPGAVVESLLALYGITRHPGTEPTGEAQFFVAPGTGEHTIPEGTRVGIDDAVFATTRDVTIGTNGEVSGTVPIVGVGVESTRYNGTPARTRITLIDSIAYVDRVYLFTQLTGGNEPETDNAFLTRGVTQLQRLTSTLVLPQHFATAALDYPGVINAIALDRYDPATNLYADGYLTVAVVGAGGSPLSAGDLAAIRDQLAARAIALLRVAVINAATTTVNVNATITVLPGYSPAAVAEAARQAVLNYLAPDEWDGSTSVYRNELISLIDRVEGVGRVVTIPSPSGDIALTAPTLLPRPGAVTIATA